MRHLTEDQFITILEWAIERYNEHQQVHGQEAETAKLSAVADTLEDTAEFESDCVESVKTCLTERLQILLAWEAGELSEGQATARLKQYGGLQHGRLEAREVKQRAIEAGKNLPYPKPLNIS